MASKTTYWNLTKLDSGEDVQTDGFATNDRDTIDQALKVGVDHHHTGALFEAPTDAPDLYGGLDGTLSSATYYSYSYTYVHPDLGESTASPAATISFPPQIAAPAPPTYTVQTVGGYLPPGAYFYVLSAYQGTTLVETTATNPVEVIIPAGTTTNQVTLTTPAIPAGATGFNLYRRGPNDSRYYFIASGDVTEFIDQGSAIVSAESLDLSSVITTEAGATIVSDPGMQTRSLPATNTTNNTNSVEVYIDDVPDGYSWNLYRLTGTGVYSRVAADLSDSDDSFLDDGVTGTVASPPTAFIGNSPEKVLLTEGAEVQGLLPGDMVAIDDAAYTTISGDTLDVVLNGIDTVLGAARQGLTIGPAGSGAHFECDGTDDQVQFEAAYALADTENYGAIFVMGGEYSFHATCNVENNTQTVLRSIQHETFHAGSYDENTVQIYHYNPTQPMFTVNGNFYVQGISMFLGGTADITNVAATASLIDGDNCPAMVLEGCALYGPYFATAMAPAILGPYSAIRIADCTVYSANNRSFLDIPNGYISGSIERNWFYIDNDTGLDTPTTAAIHFTPGGTTSNEEMFIEIAHNMVEWCEIPFIIAAEKTSHLLVHDNLIPWNMGWEFHTIQVADGQNIDIYDNKLAGSISVTNSRDVRITDNSIYESGWDCVVLDGAENCQVQDNNIRDAGTMEDGTYAGIRVTGASTGNLLAGNIFRGYQDPATMAAAIIIDVTAEDTEVLQNSYGGFDLVDNGINTSFGPIGYHAIVDHGAVAGTARPDVFGPVLWRGTVEPTNAIAGDDWQDDSVGSGGSIDGGTL